MYKDNEEEYTNSDEDIESYSDSFEEDEVNDEESYEEDQKDEDSSLLKELSECQEKIESFEKEYLLKVAELKESEKRMKRDLEFHKSYSTEKLILSFLDVLDNFDRALEAEGDIREGVKLIRKQFFATLEKEGVEQISVDKFDPEFHQAVSCEQGEDRVIELRKGYKMKNKVIRPTMVKVFKEEV